MNHWKREVNVHLGWDAWVIQQQTTSPLIYIISIFVAAGRGDGEERLLEVKFSKSVNFWDPSRNLVITTKLVSEETGIIVMGLLVVLRSLILFPHPVISGNCNENSWTCFMSCFVERWENWHQVSSPQPGINISNHLEVFFNDEAQSHHKGDWYHLSQLIVLEGQGSQVLQIQTPFGLHGLQNVVS